MVSRRRIEALRNLAERGATPGEREAARRALEIHQGKQAQGKPPEQGYVPYGRARPTRHSAETDAYYAAMYTAARNTAFFHAAYSFSPEYLKQQASEDLKQQAYDRMKRDQARGATTQPPKDAFRPAVKDDFPEAEDAIDGPVQDTLRVRVATFEEVCARFECTDPFKVHWRGAIWQVNRVHGVCHDNDYNRYYLTLRRADMTPCFVPA